jgi:hypothetical protein
MTTDALAKLYDRLKPFERLPLIVAATARGDKVEADRLAESAPRIHVSLPDYWGIADGLMRLSVSHLMVQLDLTVVFCLAADMVDKLDATDSGKKKKAERNRFWTILRLVAFRICVGADAWKRLCGELKIEPEMVLGHLPGYYAIQLVEKAARPYAFTPEEAAAYLRKSGGEGAELPTVEAAAKEMREFIDRRIRWWD